MMTSQNPEPVELTSVTLKTVVDLQSVRVKDEHSNLDKTRKKVLRQRRQKLHHLDKNSGRAHMFGITCNFGTDDFFFMPLIGAALRATWLAFGVAVCIYSFLLPGSPASCASIRLPVVLLTSLLGLLGLHLLTILLYLATTILSSLGSLIRPKPRAKVVVVAYILILVSAVELGWLVLSTYSAVDAYIGLNATVTLGSGGGSGGLTVRLGSGDLDISGGGSGNGISDDDSICSPYESAVLAFSLLVIAAWVVYSMILLGLIIFLDPCGCCLGSALVQRIARTQKYHSKDYNDKSLADFDKFDSIQGLHGNDLEYSLLCAKLRETFCSCCRRDGLKSSRKDALSDVVQVLRILFSDVDTTFSDLLAGFLLASLYQQNLMAANKCTDHELTKATVKLLKEKFYVPTSYTTPPPQPLTSKECETLSAELNYYHKYCVATYGCPVHIYLNPCQGPLSLCIASRGCCCCCCNICQLEHYEGDTCYPNTAAIQEIAGVYPEEILTASFINSVYKVPYYVAYDADNKRLIVAIRGTLSIEDALTDVSVSMWEIPEGLLGIQPSYVHKGFYESALYMYKALMERCSRVRDKLNEKDGVKEFVITGHSLGAAVACVLTVLFKDRHSDAAWINSLRAITFSTPGAIMSYLLAEKTKDFILSVVGGNDMVPRMTMRSLGHLKMLVGTMLVTVDHPKHQVLCCSGRGACQCCPPHVLEEEDLLGLAHSEKDLQSMESLDLASDVNISFKRLKTYLPFLDSTVTVDPVWKKKQTRETVSRLSRQINLLRGGAQERDENPAMFIPGRVLHLEDSHQYGLNQCCGLKKRRQVRASWKARESISTILIHKDMVLDHTPHRMVSILERFQLYPDLTAPTHPHTSTLDDHHDNGLDSARARVFTLP